MKLTTVILACASVAPVFGSAMIRFRPAPLKVTQQNQAAPQGMDIEPTPMDTEPTVAPMDVENQENGAAIVPEPPTLYSFVAHQNIYHLGQVAGQRGVNFSTQVCCIFAGGSYEPTNAVAGMDINHHCVVPHNALLFPPFTMCVMELNAAHRASRVEMIRLPNGGVQRQGVYVSN